MKFATVLISMLVIASQSHAGFPGFNRGRPTPSPVPTAPLEAVVVPAGELVKFGNPNAAIVTIDKSNDTLKLALFKDICHTILPSPAGEIHCEAEAVPLQTYEVRLESVKDGECDTVIYQGSVNHRMVDGPAYELVVADNRNFYNNCTSFVPVAPTSGTLKVLGTRGVEDKELSFEGAVLK